KYMNWDLAWPAPPKTRPRSTKPHRTRCLKGTLPPDGRNTFPRLRTFGRDMIGPPNNSGERGDVSPPLLRQAGLRYHGKAIAPGGQTVRRARPGRCAICVAADTHRPLGVLLCFVTTTRAFYPGTSGPRPSPSYPRLPKPGAYRRG